jgi:molybdopterin synthase catalytic subunit
MMLVLVTDHPLDESLARSHVAARSNGAILLFLGVVRDRHEGRAVSSVEYDAYRPMAERELASISRTVAGRHGIDDVAVLHRVGRLAVGEVSLVVAVGAPHREPAFRCALEIIDTLKLRVPIWKKEIGPAGVVWQEGTVPPTPDDAAGERG